jgi:hypothetical protein
MSEYKSSWKQILHLGKNKGKVMLEILFDVHVLFHYEFIPEGHTVNKEIYIDIPCHLREA